MGILALSRRDLMIGSGSLLVTGLSGCDRPPTTLGQGDWQPRPPGRRTGDNRPNFLFISVDDLNDWTGFLGGHPLALTPHMDRLAKRSAVFTRSYCAAPNCNASRASTLTGRHPASTGIYTNRQPLRMAPGGQAFLTLPQLLRSRGYFAAGAGKTFHSHFPDPASWDAFWPALDSELAADPEPPAPPDGLTFPDGSRSRLLAWGDAGAEGPDDQEIAFAAEKLRGPLPEPFFFAAGITKPHAPWIVPARYRELYDPADIRLPMAAGDDLGDLPVLGRHTASRNEAHNRLLLKDDQVKEAVAAYLAAVTYADDMVGRLLDALDNGPNRNNTIIVLWSDHGYHLGEKTLWTKYSLWEQATRVPLLFAPAREDGSAAEWAGEHGTPVSLLDIYPTVCDLAGLSVPADQDGQSLRPFFGRRSGEGPDRHVVTTHQRGNHAVRSRDWRYIRYRDGTEELYDHRADPEEVRNLLFGTKTTSSELQDVVHAHARHLPDTDAPEAPSVRWPEQRAKAMRAALRAQTS
jgi:arylsulfatase A-like enzyme